MTESLMEPDTPSGAWCSHCLMLEPQSLRQAIAHRRANHMQCWSCRLEIILFDAILRGSGHGIHWA